MYSEIELGPCGCPAGVIPTEIDELINGPRASEDFVAESRAAQDASSKDARKKHEKVKQKIEDDYKSEKLRAYETPAPRER